MPGVTRYLPRLIPVDQDGARQGIADLLEQADRDPGSVPYGVDALEAVAAWLATISDKHDEQPERERYLNWLVLRAREHGGTWAEAVQFQDDELPTCDQSERIAWQWMRGHAAAPFPVGRGCPELGPGMPAEATQSLMPLECAEYAFAVEPQGERGGCLLFMAKTTPRRFASGREWIGQELTVVPDGARVVAVAVPQRSISKATQAAARRRWREVNGLPTGAGRHAGAAFWTPARIVHALLEYVAEKGSVPPSRDQFVMWARDTVTPEDEQPELEPGSVKVLGDRWTKRLGVAFDTLSSELGSEADTVWTVEGEASTEA